VGLAAAAAESCSCSSASGLRSGRQCTSSWTAARRLGRRSGNSRTRRSHRGRRPRRCGCTSCLQSHPRSRRSRFRRRGYQAVARSYSDLGAAACSRNRSCPGACSSQHSLTRHCSRLPHRPACSSGGRCRSPRRGRNLPSRQAGGPTGGPACQSLARCNTCSCPQRWWVEPQRVRAASECGR
jgi:hypothetical protein